MNYPQFNISGRVINSKTEEGIYNLRVEAWDKDAKYNDLVGVVQTGRDGRFEISFDLSYFREYYPDNAPDLFFKVFKSKKLLKSTEDSVIWNAGQKTDVTIRIEITEEQREGKDYISSEHIFKYANFFVKSDFKGIYKQTKAKAFRSATFAKDMFKNTLNNLNIEPISVEGPRIDEIVNQDLNVAQNNLEARQITVNEVKEYNPEINKNSLRDITSLPLNLKAGQKVNLYQENGKVRYYSVIKTEKISDTNMADQVIDQQKEIGNLREEIKQARIKEEKKDEEILQLQKTVKSLQKEQSEIKQIIQKNPDIKLTDTNNIPVSKKTRKKPSTEK